MVIIRFIESENNDRYIIDPSSVKLGRRYDNNAEYIQVVFPKEEQDSKCTMIVKDKLNNGIDLIEFENTELKPVTTTLSQYENVLIGFVFTKDNYAKYSSYKTFYFEPSLYPNNFEPQEPEFKGSYMEIINRTFASVRKNENNESLIEFLNIKGEVVDTITIVGGGGGGITNETDPTVPNYVKNITEQEINNWNNSLQKNTTEKGNRVYVSQSNPMGEIGQSTIEFSDNVSANTIAKREESGCLNVGTPTKGTHATSKDYVDDRLGDVIEISQGKTKSFTVRTLAELGTLLGIDTSVISDEYSITSSRINYNNKVFEMKQGDLFLIVDTNVPDYWVSLDDMKIYKMETTKVNLSEYAKLDYVDNIAKKIPTFNATLLDDGSYSLLIISSLEE